VTFDIDAVAQSRCNKRCILRSLGVAGQWAHRKLLFWLAGLCYRVECQVFDRNPLLFPPQVEEPAVAER
jgi:hypothetical protein